MVDAATGRPPGPPPGNGGILGTLKFLHGMLTDAPGTVGARFERYGDVYFVPNDDGGLYVLRTPEHLEQVLMRQAGRFDKSHSAMQRLTGVLGQGLLTSDGEVWKRHRRMLQPAFNRKAMARYGDAIVREALRTAEVWSTGGERDVSREMMELTLRIVSLALFSHDVSADTDTVARAMQRLNDVVGRPELTPKWFPSPWRLRSKAALAALDGFIASVIAQRQDMDEGLRPADLLQAMLDTVDADGDGQGLTPREVRDHLVTLYLAGHETTSHCLSWTWWLLSQSPEIEARLHAHLADVLGDRVPTVEDVPQLDLVDRILKESLRLYPPAYLVGRRAIEDVDLGDVTIAAGSELVLWIFHTHRDPRVWPDPERFDPDRFLPEAAAERPRCAWLPFGAGARACIGARFAMLEATLIVATLAQRVRLTPTRSAPPKPHTRVTLSPAGGLPMRITPR